MVHRFLDERDDDGDNERVDRDRLGERRADDHRGLDLATSLRVATDGLHRATDGHTDAERRAKTADTDRDARANRLRRVNALWSYHSVKHVTLPPVDAGRYARMPASP
jgi:hypothetical protein